MSQAIHKPKVGALAVGFVLLLFVAGCGSGAPVAPTRTAPTPDAVQRFRTEVARSATATPGAVQRAGTQLAQPRATPFVGQHAWMKVQGYDKAVECDYVFSGIQWQRTGECRRWISSEVVDLYRSLDAPRPWAQVDLSQSGFAIVLIHELDLYVATNLQTGERSVREPGGEYIPLASWEQQQTAVSATRQAVANATAQAAAAQRGAAAGATAQAQAASASATDTARTALFLGQMADRQLQFNIKLLEGPCATSAFGCRDW